MRIVRDMALVATVAILLAATMSHAASFEDPRCQEAAAAMANTLSQSAFGADADAPSIVLDGVDECAHYTIGVQSKPFRWKDGLVRPQRLVYTVVFDNDSELQCSLSEARLKPRRR